MASHFHRTLYLEAMIILCIHSFFDNGMSLMPVDQVQSLFFPVIRGTFDD